MKKDKNLFNSICVDIKDKNSLMIIDYKNYLHFHKQWDHYISLSYNEVEKLRQWLNLRHKILNRKQKHTGQK